MDAGFDLALQFAVRCSGPGAVGVLLNSLAPTGALQLHSTEVCSAVLQQLRPSLHEDVGLPDTMRRQHNPFFRWIMESAASQGRTMEDCGWDLITFAALLRRSLRYADLLRSEKTRSLTAEHLLTIRRWIEDATQPPSPEDKRPWIGVLSSSHYRQLAIDGMKVSWTTLTELDALHVAKIVLTAFYHCVDDTTKTAYPGRIRYALANAPFDQTRLVPGIFLEWQMPLEGQLLLPRSSFWPHDENGERQDLKVLLFSCSLEADSVTARLVVGSVRRFGVKLVASQRTIHPLLRERLYKLEVIAVERLSIQHINTFSVACGAAVYATVVQLDRDRERIGVNLGRLQGLREVVIGSTRMLHLQSPVSRDVSTVVVSCPVPSHTQAFATTVRRTIRRLCLVFGDPFVVSGGGGFEMFLSQYLLHRWSLLPLQQRVPLAATLQAFRDALQAYVRTIIIQRKDGQDTPEDAVDRFKAEMNRSSNFFQIVSVAKKDREPFSCAPPAALADKHPSLTYQPLEMENGEFCSLGWDPNKHCATVAMRVDLSTGFTKSVEGTVLPLKAKRQALLDAMELVEMGSRVLCVAFHPSDDSKEPMVYSV